jgi:hypothetical protein
VGDVEGVLVVGAGVRPDGVGEGKADTDWDVGDEDGLLVVETVGLGVGDEDNASTGLSSNALPSNVRHCGWSRTSPGMLFQQHHSGISFPQYR